MSEHPDWFAGNYEYQFSMFVLTHQSPPRHPGETDQLTFTFVTVESAVRQAKAAAGGKEINIIGTASTAQQCRRAGLADELHVDITPVLPGGLRSFEHPDADQIQ